MLVARSATGTLQSITPDSSTIIAVSVQVPNETMNVSITALSPCCDGRVALRGAVRHRRGAVARFVRIQPAREAIAHRGEHAEARAPTAS